MLRCVISGMARRGLRPIDCTVSLILVMPVMAKIPSARLRKVARGRCRCGPGGRLRARWCRGAGAQDSRCPNARVCAEISAAGRAALLVITRAISLVSGCPTRSATSRRMTASRRAYGRSMPCPDLRSVLQVLQRLIRPCPILAYLFGRTADQCPGHGDRCTLRRGPVPLDRQQIVGFAVFHQETGGLGTGMGGVGGDQRPGDVDLGQQAPYLGGLGGALRDPDLAEGHPGADRRRRSAG